MNLTMNKKEGVYMLQGEKVAVPTTGPKGDMVLKVGTAVLDVTPFGR